MKRAADGLPGEIDVTGPGGQDIIEQRFEKRRRGYDTAAVDEFLGRVAEHVERLQNELARRATDKTALDLLKKAERIANDTRLGAEIDANRMRETAAKDADQARLSAAGLVEQGRSEATRITREAEAEATRIISRATAEAAAIDQRTRQLLADLRQKMQGVSEFVTESAADLRLGAERMAEMAEMAEMLQSELTTPSTTAELGRHVAEGADAVVDVREPEKPRSLFDRAARPSY